MLKKYKHINNEKTIQISMKFQNAISETKRDRRKIQMVYYLRMSSTIYVKMKIFRVM